MDDISSSINFWFEFDDMSNPGFVMLDEEGNIVMEEDGITAKRRINQDVFDELKMTFFNGDHAIDAIFLGNYNRNLRRLDYSAFKEKIEIENFGEILKSLSGRQLEIIHRHFHQYDDLFRDVFEYFGQGALYDTEHDSQRTILDRQTGRLIKYRIHMADGAGIYGRWHAFIRAILLYNGNVTDWLTIDRALAAAYIIHYKVNPIQSYGFLDGDKSSKNIPEAQKIMWRQSNSTFLQNCRDHVSNANIEILDSILGQSFTFSSPL